MSKLWGALAICLLVSPALAESEADRLFNEGRALLAKNDPKGACEKFEAAIKVDPSATGTMLNLGLCYENLKQYATSIFWFRKAQVAAAEGHLTEYEAAAKKYTVELAPKVPTLRVEVEGPPETEIRIDGKIVDPTDYGQVEVDPGSHEVTGQAPGKLKVTQSVEAKVGGKGTVVHLAVVHDLAAPIYRNPHKRLGLIVGAGGVVLWGATLAHGLYYRGIAQDADAQVPKNDDEFDSANRQITYVTTSLFIAGTAAVAVGAYLYFKKPTAEVQATAIAPYVTGDEAGLAISGSF
ncbi:MAG TPA: hypothetical protein VM513_27175 [Kofleriaceae bacterium]|jgi:tetratricopeptide (TPR) repeat protein|nr:hypothetical protein [Kofleriaceae bacterium]